MIAFVDGVTGVSGDKLLGALLDAGFDPDALAVALDALDLGDFHLTVSRTSRRGVAATRVVVEPRKEEPDRSWRDVRALVGASPLPAPVRESALEAFRLLAEAEARVHGVQVEAVRFHEVGALDSIVDIVGVAAGLDALGVTELVAAPPALGSGTVSTRHGTLPVPAPAVAELLRDVPSYGGDLPGELTTPTGAALLRAFALRFGPMPAMTVTAIGYGAGSRDLPTANVTRVVLGRPTRSVPDGLSREEVVELAANLDHLSPEHVAFAAEELLAAGALDVWQTPALMKKGRAAVVLSALATPPDADGLAALLVRLTGSLGVRTRTTERVVAPREVREVETSLGTARVKVARIAGRDVVRAEYEDVARIARRIADEAEATLRGEGPEE